MIRGYIDHAANERTFLARVRTGIALTMRSADERIEPNTGVVQRDLYFVLCLNSPAVRLVRPTAWLGM